MENKNLKICLGIVSLVALLMIILTSYFYWQEVKMKSQIKTLLEENVKLENELSEKEKTKTVKLYYYNPEHDQGEGGNTLCSRNGLVAVEREIPSTQTPIQDTINFLLKGELTAEEKAQGITTEYPLEGFSLKGASLKDGVLTLTFDDPNFKTGGGSCRVGILWFQIEATAKQFSEVKQVKFYPEELFQP